MTARITHIPYSKDNQLPSTMTLDHGQWVLTIRQKDDSLLLVFNTWEDWQEFKKEINNHD